MTMAGSIKVDQRKVIAAGTVICRDSEPITIQAEGNTFKLMFENRPSEQPGIQFNANGSQLAVVVINVDAQPGGPPEMASSFIEAVGQTPQGKQLMLALYIHSRGQTKVRQVAYTLSA
jgi:hypothetical protein